ncbi:DUF3300 domain-containing protein [Arenicella xantha]|nr:DUF3300 domain-containing protein [Arenicella xantha]
MTAFILLMCGSVMSHAQDSELSDELLSEAEMEQLLAPIALYPDTILSHILIASTYPLEVIQAERWTSANPNLDATAAVNAVEDQDWDPSVRALVAFPQILQRMSQDVDWTQSLGEAFLADESRVLASVQTLRRLAQEHGSLAEMDKVTVSQDEDSIVIESREREIVYVPYYDTRSVYGAWRWAHYDPVFWDYPFHDAYYARRHPSSFYWGPRVSVSFGFFFNTLHWHNRNVVRIPDRYYRNRQYYGYRELVNHRNGIRWTHSPQHRRGVVYRNRHLRDAYRDGNKHRQYRENRPRQQQVRTRLNQHQGDGLERHRAQTQAARNAANRRSELNTQPQQRRSNTVNRPRQQVISERDQRRIQTPSNRNYRSIPDKQTRSARPTPTVTASPRSVVVPQRTNTAPRKPQAQPQTQSKPPSNTVKRQVQQRRTSSQHRQRQVDRSQRANPR